MRLHLAKAIRAYRRNPMDDYSKSLLVTVFTNAGLNEANTNRLIAGIDATLNDNSLDFGELDDAYLDTFIKIAQKMKAGQEAAEAAEAAEAEEEIEEPEELAGYPKPYLFAGSIQTVRDAKVALDEFVGVLHNEGPVKGSGAAQRQARPAEKPEKSRRPKGADRAAAPEMAADTDLASLSDEELRALYLSLRKGPGRYPTSREGYIQKIMEMRASQVTANPRKGLRVAGNPYLPARGGRALRGYRANPYLPDDQDPLSIYRSRLANPGKFPLSPLDHYRAARLLRAHTQGSQNPPDFDLGQIQAIIQVLEPEARAYGSKVNEKVPAPSDRLIASDYEIIQPLSGLVRFVTKAGVLGLLSWVWRGSTFDIFMPYYPSGVEIGTGGPRVLFSRPRHLPQGRADLIDAYQFVEALTGLRFGATVITRIRGEDPIFGISVEVGAAQIVVNSLLAAADILDNDSLRLFGNRLRQATRAWGDLNPAVFDDAPSASKGDADKLDELLRFMSKVLPESSASAKFLDLLERRVQEIKRGDTSYYDPAFINPQVIGAARVLAAIKGKPGAVVALPEPDRDLSYPYAYEYSPRPGEVVVSLPPKCLPFYLELSGGKPTFFVGMEVIGNEGGIYAIPTPDALAWKSGWWNTKDPGKGGNPWFSALSDLSNEQRGIESEKATPGIHYRRLDNQNRIPVKFAGGYSIAPIAVKPMAQGFIGLMVDPNRSGVYASLNQAPVADLFSSKFQALSGITSDKKPRVFGRFASFLFLPFVLAVYRAALQEGIEGRVSDFTISDDLILALSEGSPTQPATKIRTGDESGEPEWFKEEGVPVGAGRIEDGEVTSRTTGITVPIRGLPENVREQIKFLRPAPTFRVVETVMTGNKKRKEVRKPYPYQEVGIAFLHAAGCRAMIGDEMGLGKTIQALGALTLDPSPTTGQPMLPALIIAPSSVVGSWAAEVRRWLPHLSVGESATDDVTIITWKRAGTRWAEYAGKYATLIVDEAHYGKRLYALLRAAARPTLTDLLSPPKATKSGDTKSPYTQRTYGFVRLAHSTPHVFLLSGTLMENGGEDAGNLWTYLYALDPDRFPDRRAFNNMYFAATGEVTREKLTPFRQLFNSYHIRRMKSTVADQVGLGCLYNPDYEKSDPGCPGTEQDAIIVTIGEDGEVKIVNNPRDRGNRRSTRRNTTIGKQPTLTGYMAVGKTKEIIRADIDATEFQKAAYASILQEMPSEILRARRDLYIREAANYATRGGSLDQRALTEAVETANQQLQSTDFKKLAKNFGAVISKLRTLTAELKLPNAINWIAQQMKEGEPSIVWVQHKKVLEQLLDGIKAANQTGRSKQIRVAVVQGSTSKEQRTEIVKKFQNGELDLIIATTAMREGVTLTRANRALFVEQWWVGAWMSQAEDRIYRIGQKRDCQIYYLMLPGTVDEQVWNIVQRKKAAQGLIFGSEEFREGRRVDDGGDARALLEAGQEEPVFDDEDMDEAKQGDEDVDEDQRKRDKQTERAAVEEVTKALLEKMNEQAAVRAMLLGSGMIEISEQDVIEHINDKPFSGFSYQINKDGQDWENTYRVHTTVDKLASALARLPNSNVTESLRLGFSIAEELQKGGKPVNAYYMDQYEGGAAAYRALGALVGRGVTKGEAAIIKAVITHKRVGVELSPDEERVLTVVQELSKPMPKKLELRPIHEAVNASHNLEKGVERVTIGSVKTTTNALVKKGLLQKFDEGAIRANGTARARGIRHNGLNPAVARAIMQKPLPAALVRRMQNPSPGVLRSRAVMAAVALLGLPADPNALKFRMAAVELERAAEEAEDKGVVLPPFVHDALRRARSY